MTPTEARRARSRAPPRGTPPRWSTCTTCTTCRTAARWFTNAPATCGHAVSGARPRTPGTQFTSRKDSHRPPLRRTSRTSRRSVFRHSRERPTAPSPPPVEARRDRRPMAAEPATRAPALPTGRRPTAATRGARGARGALGARGRPAPAEEDDVAYNSAVRRQVPLKTWRRRQI